MLENIIVKGARQHNLQNIDVIIPKNKFVVFTGVSGSGKSSLAFDTIYAEGQRRYVESLSAYARQFLGIMDKPDVDMIDGLSPAISIDQKTVSHNPRSTVGTITEIYDYLRLLFARIGHPHCPNCHIEISRLSIDEITGKILEIMQQVAETDSGTPQVFHILSPVISSKKGEFRDLFFNLLTKGYNQARIDGEFAQIEPELTLTKTNKHSIDVVIDTISCNSKSFDAASSDILRARVSQAVEQSSQLSDGLTILAQLKSNQTIKNEVLFSEKLSCPSCNFALSELEPRMFSFNSPIGACPSCKGLGVVRKIDPDSLFIPGLSINEGGIMPFPKFFYQETWYLRLLKQVCQKNKIPLDKPTGKIPKDRLNILVYGTGNQSYEVRGENRFGKATMIRETFDGLAKELERRHQDVNGEIHELNKYFLEEVCGECKGQRLKSEILAVTVAGLNIAQIAELSIHDLLELFEKEINTKLNQYEQFIAGAIIKEIVTRLKFLRNVGLAYLTISRPAVTLSGGELQRIRLASQIGTGLTGVLYVLDEPSIGLHPRDVSALVATLHNLKDLGNTLIVVEHDRETIESAQYLVELGPAAGRHGGKVIATGTVAEIKQNAKSLTGQYLSGKRRITPQTRPLCLNRGKIILKGAQRFNLKNVDLKLPLGNLIVVTGVSGSGKSTLIVDTLYPALKQQLDGGMHRNVGFFQRLEGHHYLDRVYLVDQSPIGRTPRSNPATYIGLFDDIRDLFAMTSDAKLRGFTKSRFSFNLRGGRCEKCEGAGQIKIEMQFLSDVYVTCDVCKGKRYNRETLEVTYKGKNIYDVLKMTIDEALEFFQDHPKIQSKLHFLQEVGLGYVELGQAAPTFSGGEAQRIKLAHELAKRDTGKTIYILDEPTTGLHFHDVDKLLQTLYKLVERGNTVLMIEHNLDVIRNCQYIIDMGPDGGDKGGEILYQGELKGLQSVSRSHTAKYLREN